MENLIEAIRNALVDNASDDARTAGAQACRMLLTVLEAKPGEPMTTAPAAGASAAESSLSAIASSEGAPSSSAAQIAQMIGTLRGVPAEQLLDLAIARLRAALPAGTEAPRVAPLKFHIVQLPKGGRP